ncbi:MAG: RNA methyltransferase [Oscillospiraceae bacterium]
MERISSRSNEKVKRMSGYIASREMRGADGVCVADGIKLCCEAMLAGLEIKELWYTQKALERYGEEIELLEDKACESFLMSESVAEKLSDARSPQGVAALVSLPPPVEIGEFFKKRRIVALCSLQDPSNVGAVMRSAAAFGFDGVLLSGDCADAYSQKSLRGSMGAVFKCDVALCEDMAEAISLFESSGFVALAAALTDEAVPVCEAGKHEKMLVAIGNEGGGLTNEVIAACSKSVIIPMSGGVESLNAAVAASVLMWELR